jgi:hypothetical protein
MLPAHRSGAGGVMATGRFPIGISLSADIEPRPGRAAAYRARVRWNDSATKRRKSRSETFPTADAAQEWIGAMRRLAEAGVDPGTSTMTLAGREAVPPGQY